MVGTTVSHYRVVRRLGEGGMGVVYEAEDLRLGRPVALKFLPDCLACDRNALERFHAEARAASSLNHPHICTIYDIDEAGGRPFIAMELLEGEVLRARLARPLPVPTIVHITLQLAEALEAAHAKGIVHRDIKPENVFVSADGTAKLLDFGIARLVTEQAGSGATTRVGTGPLALGTVAYMSPEQARGEPLDARTDLFSLGVVLYEMATGAEPFRGPTTGAILGEILTKAPVPPVRLNPDLPPELERIVNKLLEKERELRYQSARGVRVDLERLRRTLTAPTAGSPRAGSEEASIVVLPFENLSPDPDNAFFADGLTEDLGRINLYGHSYGGMVAQAYALKYPAALLHLVLADTLHSAEAWQKGNNDTWNSRLQDQMPELWERLQALRAKGHLSCDPEYMKLEGEAPIALSFFYDPSHANRPEYGTVDLNLDVYCQLAGADAEITLGGDIASLDFRPRLREISVPTLVLAGRFDRVSIPRFAIEFARLIPGATFVMFEKSGHYPFVEEPERHDATLRAFLRKDDR